MASARASAIKWCMTCRSPPINHKQSPRKGVSESRVSQPFDDEFGNQDAPHWNCHRLLTSRMFTLLRPKPGMSSKQTSLHMMREACHVNIRLLLRGSRIWIHTDPDGSRWILLYGYWMILKKKLFFLDLYRGQDRSKPYPAVQLDPFPPCSPLGIPARHIPKTLDGWTVRENPI